MSKVTVAAELAGSVWKVEVAQGASVAAGDALIILESMKMEIPVESTVAGTVTSILVSEGMQVEEGQPIATIET